MSADAAARSGREALTQVRRERVSLRVWRGRGGRVSVPPLLAASRLPRPALAPLCSVPAPPHARSPPPPPTLSACTLPHARRSGPPRSCTALPSFRPSGRGRPGPSCWRRSGPDSRARPRSPVFAPSGCPAAAGGCSQVRVLPPHIRMQLRLHACMRVDVQTRLQLRTHARAHACVTHAPERPGRSADETACPCVVRMLTFSFFRLSRL